MFAETQKKEKGKTMSASSNVVALLAEQNSETGKSVKCLAEQKNKTDESVKSLDCAADETGRRKKRLDNIGYILETLDKEHSLKFELNKCEEEEDVIGATGEDFGIKEKRGGLPAIEPGLGKIDRRQGKRDRKVGPSHNVSIFDYFHMQGWFGVGAAQEGDGQHGAGQD